MHLHYAYTRGALEGCTRVVPCDWSAGGKGHNNVGVVTAGHVRHNPSNTNNYSELDSPTEFSNL